MCVRPKAADKNRSSPEPPAVLSTDKNRTLVDHISRGCSTLPVITLEDARQKIASRVAALAAHEVGLDASLGRVLAVDVLSDADYPSADRSMMDGYVVRADATPGEFAIAGEIPAGEIPTRALLEGEAMRIFTGAILPEGGGRVVTQEECTREGDSVRIGHFSEPLFIRRKSSEARAGDVVLKKGTRIGATEMAILAQIGCVKPFVIGNPAVKHIATGDELVAPGERPAPGKIRDTNSSLLAGLLAPLGLSVESSRLADDPTAMAESTKGDWDLLLISGGASVGDHDHGSDVLRASGFTIVFDKVNLRPGKPLTFATRGKQIAFVIPGNPVSHFVCFHVGIRLASELMCGLAPRWDFLDLKISNPDLIRPNPRETFWPATVSSSNGSLVVRALRWSTSGDTFSLTETNALIRVDPGGNHRTMLLDLPHPAS